MAGSLPQVLILGTYYMDNPTIDYLKTTHTDVLTEPHQRQLQELVHRLSAFQPTHVAIEREPAQMPGVLERYRQYLADACTLERYEWEQVGFRIARLLGHRQLYGIDYQHPIDFEYAIRYAEERGMTPLIEEVQTVMAQAAGRRRQIEEHGSLIDLFRYLNTIETDEIDHRLYIRMAPLGAGDRYIGAKLLADWYARNLIMFANIAKLAARPDDRVFVLVGAAHRPLLRQFVVDSPQLELVDPLPYLQ